MCAKTLKSFARKQISEEQKDTEATAAEVPTTETEETPTEETETEEAEEAEGTEETSTEGTQTEATDKKSANVLKAGQVAIDASELKQIKADAAEWNKNKQQFATLSDWHKSMKEAGASVPGKEDTSSQHDKTASAVSDKPWNKKASEVYGKGQKA
ncbi:hypothetical protein LX87_05194 [Larkinella arboricola]|uniref:Uncharacterized protein n=1 Tax=Larkinella arboricola TaxID=643671 RepID=A0A327WPH8_LARAB|nr:hypothetical protein [Larkinella arboricola]RAJ92226.1 hypothetical protein LX87_05194 [Larkinella arboricola]